MAGSAKKSPRLTTPLTDIRPPPQRFYWHARRDRIAVTSKRTDHFDDRVSRPVVRVMIVGVAGGFFGRESRAVG